jgi:hypothetical protein
MSEYTICEHHHEAFRLGIRCYMVKRSDGARLTRIGFITLEDWKPGVTCAERFLKVEAVDAIYQLDREALIKHLGE